VGDTSALCYVLIGIYIDIRCSFSSRLILSISVLSFVLCLLGKVILGEICH
jgi:hypothetical protein